MIYNVPGDNNTNSKRKNFGSTVKKKNLGWLLQYKQTKIYMHMHTIYACYLRVLFTRTIYAYCLRVLFTRTVYAYYLCVLFTRTIYAYYLPIKRRSNRNYLI